MNNQMRIRCTFLTDYKSDDLNPSGKTMWFDAEEGKKSAFFLNLTEHDSMINIDKPCHILVDCCQYNNTTDISRSTWLFGGMEIHSNAKNIEVYASEGTTSSEQYWQTCPGMQIQDANDNDGGIPRPSLENPLKEKKWHKTIILPPSSKPTSVKILHLKLLSLRPVKCTVGSVRTLKMKGRIFDIHSVALKSENETNEKRKDNQVIKQDDKIVTPPSIPSQNYPGGKIPINHMVNEGDGISDVSKAILALSMQMRNIQSDMQKSISSSIGEMQKVGFDQHRSLAQRVTEIEKNVENVQDMLARLLNEVKMSREETQAQEESRRKREEILKKETERELLRSQQKQDSLMNRLMEDQRIFLSQEIVLAQKEMLESMVDKILNSRGIEKGRHISSHNNHGLCGEEMNRGEVESSSKSVVTDKDALPIIDTTIRFVEGQTDEQQDFELLTNGDKNDSTENMIKKML